MTPTRPIVRYHGGKWKLAPWIISNFPEHRIYTEVFGGGGSVLIRKARSYSEVYNDLDGEMVNLFRVVRQDGKKLAELLHLTPFSREEYRESFEEIAEPIEQARRTLVRSFMGFGSNALCRSIKSGFRANSNRSGTTPAHAWANFPDCVPALIDRLRGVVIENKDAVEVMLQHDSEETLHYADPPYVHSTRTQASHGHHGYNFELTDEQHAELAVTIRSLKGAVVLSGYACDLYDKELYKDWFRVDRAAHADGALDRVEVLWMNREPPQARMFA